MTEQERLAQIANLVEVAKTALTEAAKLAEEGGIEFTFSFPEESDEESDWQESDWADSGCTID